MALLGLKATALLFIGCTLLLPAAAHGQLPGGDQIPPFRFNDFGGFRDVLPPGTNGLANAPQLAAFLATGQRPPHNDDQLPLYRDLLDAAPGLSESDLEKHYKDASFGFAPGDGEMPYHPGARTDVTVVRDKSFGVPHVYGQTRAGAMFALGYVAAEDRLFFMDVLRHLGRAQLSSFAGGAPANRQLDQEQWRNAPYTEEDLQRQYDQGDDLYGDEGRQVQEDAESYVAGVNQYILEAKVNAAQMPGEYAAINRPLGPAPWKVTDSIAVAAVAGGVFGKGGGQELSWAQLLTEFQERFGEREGLELFRQFSSAHDPEAPTTVHGKRFPYQPFPKDLPSSAAVPDKGTVELAEVVESGIDSESRSSELAAGRGEAAGLGGLLSFPATNSNALLVARRKSRSGHPLAVHGPQVAYFSPEVLMEQDVHAPGIDARGATFPGINLYVQLGRGRDYSWSATSAGQDTTDTFALELCEPGDSKPSLDSDHYRFRRDCLAMEDLRRTNAWTPSAADQTEAGSQTLHVQRTRMGLVVGRAELDGKPVAYSQLRTTYFHEADSAGGFADFNNPDKMRNARDFQRAAYKIAHTFNWFYADDRDIAYFNSGNNPERPSGLDPLLPTRAKFEWRGFDPADNTARYTPFDQHPRTVNQSFLTSWNNKQARGYAGAPSPPSSISEPGSINIFGSVHRSQPLDDRIRRRLRGDDKMELPELVDAMEDAATVDLRGDRVLPLALAVLGSQQEGKVGRAVKNLRAWSRDGAHRIDRDGDGTYEHSDAITIMDAWWPLLLEAEFKPVMGRDLFGALTERVQFDNAPNNHGDHLGSAYQDGWYSYAHKDLRTVLGKKVTGPYAEAFCGRGDLDRCRKVLADSLAQALEVDRSELYDDPVCNGNDGDDFEGDQQACYDAIRFRPLGGITQPLIPWQNRPTYQQVVEVQGHRHR